MLQPDNIFYFITLFTIAIFGGTYLLFYNNRNRLTIILAIMYYLCGIRIFTEYYLQQVDSFEHASKIGAFHSCILTIIGALLWYSVWCYIRPFRNWKNERTISLSFVWGLIVLPFIIGIYPLLKRDIYKFYPEKINGRWLYYGNSDSIFIFLGDLHIQAMSLIMVLLLASHIIKNPVHRLRKIFLVISFIATPVIFFLFLRKEEGYNIPNFGILYLTHTIIVSWFISEYRLFKNRYTEVTKDLLNSISELAISTDMNLNITNVNKHFQELFDAQSKNFPNLIVANGKFTLKEVEQFLKPLLNKEAAQVELVLRSTNKEERIMNMKVAPLKRGEFQFGYTFLLTDLTIARNRERELEALNATKDHLFAIISHDLRKPALAFRGISKKVNFLIQQKEFNTLEQFGQSLENSAVALNTLLNNLLNWALKEKDILPYNPMPLNIQQVTKDIYESFVPLAQNKGIVLTVKIPEEVRVFTDPNAFHSIVRNLLDNAVKYTSSGGKIEISAMKVHQQVLLEVTDTGIGIAPNKLKTIFELEKNKSTKGTHGERGSGLGLNLVRDLVLLNKGEISVNSEKQRGTTFKILLPAA